jgi:hypothetical protein
MSSGMAVPSKHNGYNKNKFTFCYTLSQYIHSIILFNFKMKSIATLSAAAFVIAMCLVSSSAFAPPAAFSRITASNTVINMGLLNPDGDERKVLTRDNEPDEFFST